MNHPKFMFQVSGVHYIDRPLKGLGFRDIEFSVAWVLVGF